MLDNFKNFALIVGEKLGNKDKRKIFLLGFIALLMNVLIVLIPLIQKHIIDNITRM